MLQVLDKLGVETLVPIGGDDTLSYAERLHREGVHIVAIPKTMDNDVYGTDYCIGFSTAITRSVEFIHQLRTSAGSHERIAVVELFGRNSGETVSAGVLSGRRRSLHHFRSAFRSGETGGLPDGRQEATIPATTPW